MRSAWNVTYGTPPSRRTSRSTGGAESTEPPKIDSAARVSPSAAAAYTRLVDGAMSSAYRDIREMIRGRPKAPPYDTELRARLLPHLVGLDDVADPDVVVVAERQAALEALADLGRVV